MSKGKLEVVKQEKVRVNIDILGIRELKWTVIGEFNSDNHYIYYRGQESLRRKVVAIIVNKSTEMQYLGAVLKMTEWSLCPRQIIQYTAIQVYALTSNAEEAEVEQFCEGLQDLLELTPKKKMSFSL